MAKEILCPVHSRVPKEHLEAMQAQAEREFLGLSDIVRRAIREWLAMQEEKKNEK